MATHINIRLLRWYNFFQDFRPYGPIAILYFSQVTGSYALGISIFSVFSFSQLIFEVPTGILSDRVGRKCTLILGSIAATLELVFYSIGTNFWILAVGGLCAGLAQALFSGNNDALLYDSLQEDGKEKHFAEVSGKLSSFFQLGLATSALIGGVFAQHALVWAVRISILPQLIALFLACFISEPKRHTEKINENVFVHLTKSLRSFRSNFRLRNLSLSSILNFGLGESMHQFMPAFFVTVWPIWALGFARMMSHVAAFLGFHHAGWFIRRFGALRMLFTGSIINNIFGIAAVGYPTKLSPLLYSVTSFPFAIGHTAQNTLLQEQFTDRQRATMSSINAFFGNLAFIIFATVLGVVADLFTPSVALLIGEFFLLPVAIIYWRLMKS